MTLCKKFNILCGAYFYAVFRVLVGGLFFAHGLMKMPGTFGNMMWFAGVIELVVGAALVLGVFARLFAWIGAIEMAVAYFMVHATKGMSPFNNGGELALMFLAAFLAIAVHGAGRLSLEKIWAKEEMF